MQRNENRRLWTILGMAAGLSAVTVVLGEGPALADRGHHRGGYVRAADRDRDGIPNRVDRERDGDGIPNWRDRRPNVWDRNDGRRRPGFGMRPNATVRRADDWDRDGIPNWRDRDRDGDGIRNERDRYPNHRRRR